MGVNYVSYHIGQLKAGYNATNHNFLKMKDEQTPKPEGPVLTSKSKTFEKGVSFYDIFHFILRSTSTFFYKKACLIKFKYKITITRIEE